MEQLRCFECNAPADHMHHVVPKSLGGTRTLPLCTGCHGKVHDKDLTTMNRLRAEGMRRAKSKGVQIGRKFVEQTAPETVARVLELRKSGMGMCRIADEVGLSSRTVWRLLQRAALGRADSSCRAA